MPGRQRRGSTQPDSGGGFWDTLRQGASDVIDRGSQWVDDTVQTGQSAVDGVTDWFQAAGENVSGAVDWWTSITDDEKEASPSGWVDTGETRDVTASYDDLVERAANGENTLPEDAQDYLYLNVPGLFTERYPGYMDENMQRMQELGLDARMVDMDTDASVESNAEAIRDAILAAVEEDEGRQVVLSGHSKGGVDIAAALAMYPELAPHVRAVVAMQTPYGGTPIADDVAGNGTLLGLADQVITDGLSGDVAALTDLTYDARQDFLADNPYPQGIPTVSYATQTESNASATRASQWYMDSRYGLASDGLVPVGDAILPGSDVVYANGVDHAGAAMGSPFGGPAASQPGNIHQALLTLALQQANERDSGTR